MKPTISKNQLLQVQITLLVAIALQFAARRLSGDLLPGSQYIIIVLELLLVVLLSFTASLSHSRFRRPQHALAIIFLALLSAANFSSLVYMLHSLIVNHINNGEKLLVSAIAIFITNIIVYALWYWEVDSPGLTGQRWLKHDKSFKFTQQDMVEDFPNWEAQFGDYLFIAITNAVSFAPADTMPLTLQAKALMASQSLVSLLTLALVIARAVNILGT